MNSLKLRQKISQIEPRGDKQAAIMAIIDPLNARIKELETALHVAAMDLHYRSEHRGSFPDCDHTECEANQAILAGARTEKVQS